MSLGRQVLTLILWFAGSIAHGQERFEFYNGARQMGMGGAGIASVNDETALLINPAALGKLRGPLFTLLDPEVHGSSTLPDFYREAGSSNLLSPQGLLDVANRQKGSHMHAKAQLFPSFVTTNFGIGVLGKYSFDGEVDKAGTDFRMDYTNDFALVLGYTLRLFDGRIKIGGSGRFINRAQVARTLPANSTGLELKDLVKEGGGIAGDAGLIISAPWAWLPTLTGVWRDVGHTSFDTSTGFFFRTSERPAMVHQTVDVGFSLSPLLSNHIRMQISGEYRDVLTASTELDHIRRAHAGLEINFGDAFFLRGGMNQRYWTAGVELSVVYFQLQLTSYGEEIGTAATATTPAVTKEDRRYIVKFAIRF